ncbi:MAG: glycosyltransferase family 4 protein [Nannocystis sp.]|nr:glycosyltransferase family 4 protein [Nannocystis sp.]
MKMPVLLFADRLPPLTGGMEMHARYFIEHFQGHAHYPLLGVVTRDEAQRDCLLVGAKRVPQDLRTIVRSLAAEPAIVFFNSGRWIEDIVALRAALPSALFVYRTGGNEILKASLDRHTIAVHDDRQRYWVDRINGCVDVLITNSAFTEERLESIGVRRERFVRCVGGVNVAALRTQEHRPDRPGPPVIFCAARFVPYKNHGLLLDAFAALMRQGIGFRLRLAGDGPLLDDAQVQARRLGLGSCVEFLGLLTNEQVCELMVDAEAYVQLSSDFITQVPGGSYVHSEGMGRSILEALSCGTYVIAARSGALPEIVTPDRGMLVDLGLPDAVADAIAPMLRSPPTRPEPHDFYSWERYFARYERCWEEAYAVPRGH